MCVVVSNFEYLFVLYKGVIEVGVIMEEILVVDESVKKWSFEMVEGVIVVVVKIQVGIGLFFGGIVLVVLGGVGLLSSVNEDDEGIEVEVVLKWMEIVSIYEIIFFWFGGLFVIINFNWFLFVLIIFLYGNKLDFLFCDCQFEVGQSSFI